MNNKEFWSKVAHDTIDILNSGQYTYRNQTIEIKNLIENSVKNTILYSPIQGEKLFIEMNIENSYQTIFKATNETTLRAAKRLLDEGYENVVALNFASAKNPGGGFLNGSTAQEESLARASALYHTLIQKKEMYDYNKKLSGGLYSDYMIYSPKVPVIKNDMGELLESPYTCSFITSPAVNVKAVKPDEKTKIRATMQTRIEKILAIALEHKNEAIVLGAFGCGVFGNRAVDIAQIFKQVLNDIKFKGKFKKVIFAVYDKTPKKEIYNVFKNTFR
jgi:uncharacterized protein (TIGR02452 family)